MRDIENLDQRLRDALHTAARPAEPAGVADAIRHRVDAGESGAVVSTAVAPGWGGFGGLGWVPWIGVVVAAAIVGGTLGATGMVGGSDGVTPTQGFDVFIPRTVDARSCIDGPVVATLAVDTRVLAVQRNDDAGWAGVRNPSSLGDIVWVPVRSVAIDEGQPSLDGLSLGGDCPVIEALVPTPVPAPIDDPIDPGPGPAPGPNPGPDPDPDPEPEPVPPPSDTTPPRCSSSGST